SAGNLAEAIVDETHRALAVRLHESFAHPLDELPMPLFAVADRAIGALALNRADENLSDDLQQRRVIGGERHLLMHGVEADETERRVLVNHRHSEHGLRSVRFVQTPLQRGCGWNRLEHYVTEVHYV